jgi:coenzyme F420-reducing hydrogenase delta subunit
MRTRDERGPVLAFFCNWAPYRCWMDSGRSGHSLPHAVYPIKTMCAGRIDPAMVLYAFERGAEGVLVLGCREKECRFGPGPHQTEKLSGTVHGLMRVLGLEPERFSAVKYSTDEEARLFEELVSFSERLRELGKSPLAR